MSVDDVVGLIGLAGFAGMFACTCFFVLVIAAAASASIEESRKRMERSK